MKLNILARSDFTTTVLVLLLDTHCGGEERLSQDTWKIVARK
jgi:hypothetical protein